ncbi:MAG: tetratricopeptide repeat protein, partial [Chloroflexi bacterium]|nr:tetratricopeptide repeat protein [Chloroflexota bacterium]
LEFAYNSLAPREQKLISQLSAFRSPLTWDALAAIFTTEGTEKEKNLTTKNTKDTKKNKNKISSAPSAVRFDFANEEELARAVMDLSERGLYQRDEKANTYDLHPVIRRYCYDRLSDKTATHARFVMYFEKIETPRKISSLADLQPTIELYHHTVRAGRYTEAEVLFFDRLHNPLYYQLGAYQNIIELLRALFPQGNESLPPLDTDDKKAFTLNSLANSYSLSGQPRRAVPVFEQAYLLAEKMGNKKNLAIGLVNVADDQLKIGELAAAERNQRRSIEICREIKEEFYEADGHREFGRVLAYRGEFAEAEKELNVAFEIFGKQNVVQSQSVVSAYRALRALLMGNASAALDAAHKAREFAEEWERTTHRNERDFIRAEWLIGAALVAGSRGEAFAQAHSKSKTPGSIPITLPDNYTLANASPLQRAEHHLQEALARDRAINLVESEAEILLELARLRKSQAMTMDDGRKTENGSVVGQPSAVALMQESFNFANEALEIAERCEYRLQQAEIQNFLAEWHWQMADSRWQIAESGKQKAESRDELLAQARAHAERARECARCDGPPHYYKVAYERAEKLLKQIDAGTR